MRLVIPILITLIVFAFVFNNQTEFSTFIDRLSKEEKIIDVEWEDLLNKLNSFSEDTKETFDSWKGEYTVEGEWQWYDYVGNFFTGFWNGLVDIINGISQFGTTICLILFYCGISLIEVVNYTVLGFRYLVGMKI